MDKKRKSAADPLDDLKELIGKAGEAGDEDLLLRFAQTLPILFEQTKAALKAIATKKHKAGDASVETCYSCKEVITGAEVREVCGTCEYASEEDGCGELFHVACMTKTECGSMQLCEECIGDYDCPDCDQCAG